MFIVAVTYKWKIFEGGTGPIGPPKSAPAVEQFGYSKSTGYQTHHF